MIYLNILLLFFSFNSDLIKIERTADISNGHYFIDDTSLPFPFSPVTFFKFGFPDKSLVIVDIYKIEKEQQSITKNFYIRIFEDTLDGGMYSGKWSEKSYNGIQAPDGEYQYFVQINSLDTNSNTIFKSFSKTILIYN
ncbi:MAG TPA: hypothetical protein DIS94_10505 [Bacteroidetes bacterium]|nr:hypothetical protein [Bacteroidota bacterium]